jgi:hypothetical protein
MTILDRFGGVYGSAQPVIEVPQVPTLRLDARSSMLLNPAYAAQSDRPGMYQPFSTTGAAFLAAMGSPAGFVAADALALWGCDTATPLLDSLGLGPNLVAGGSPLTQREGVGLPTSSFNARLVCETTTNDQNFVEAAHSGYGEVPALQRRTFGIIARLNPSTGTGPLFCLNAATNCWFLDYSAVLGKWRGYTFSPGFVLSVGPACPPEGAWCYAALTIDDTAKVQQLLTDTGDSAPAGYGVNAIVDATSRLQLGLRLVSGGCAKAQIAFAFILRGIATKAMLDTFFRAFKTSAFNTPSTYTRTSPLRCAIAASRVADYSAGQVAVGFNASAVAATGGNSLGTGILMEEGATFLALGTNNQAAYAGTNATVAGATGPSGMLRAARVTDVDGVNAGYASSLTAALAGATAVPFAFEFECQAVAAGGLNAVVQAVFTGGASATQVITLATLAGTVPAAWASTFATCTPADNDRTGVTLRLLPTDGVGASTGVVDFSVRYGIQNRATAIAAWAGTAAADVTTVTPTWAVDNTVVPLRYDPARGSFTFGIAGFPGAAGATFLGWGAAAAAGSLVLDYSGGQLRLRMYDTAGALVATLNGGALGTGYYSLSVLWDAYAPLPIQGAPGLHLAICSGNTVLAGDPTTWTPSLAGPATLMMGTDSAGANPCRCLLI